MNYKLLIATIIAVSGFSTARSLSIESNSVYRVKNFKGTYMSASGVNAVTTADKPGDNRQEWFFTATPDGNGFYLRNVQTGAYLKSPHATSQMWSLVFTDAPTDDMNMIFSDYEDMVIFHSKGYTSYNYAHSDAANNVVCWTYVGSANTKWALEKIDKTPEEIDEILDNFQNVANEVGNAATYQPYLDNLFTDASCSVLKNPDINLEESDDYNALSANLKKIVRKIKGNDWSETYNYKDPQTGEFRDYDWNDTYARRYRVQLYEPFSEGSDGAALMSIQPYTNMNNPTGIVGDKDDLIYVFVQDEVPAGATLYIQEVPDEGMYNSTTGGVKLHQGLNVLICSNDNSHFFIYYTVNSADRPAGAARFQPNEAYKLANFSPIKIHIEGGRLNGFFNPIGDSLYGQDTQEEFNYTVQRATHPMYDFLGRYVIMHFHLFDTPSHPGEAPQRCVKTCLFDDLRTDENTYENDPVKIVQAWDKMCLAERILMGIQDDQISNPYNKDMYEAISLSGESWTAPDGTVYSLAPSYRYHEYFNNRMMAISMPGDLFMNATSYRTAYNVSTIDAILTQFCKGDIWGPAHEYGHMNQGPLKMAGTTEVSNNVFSNVATYFAGRTTSRSDFISSEFRNFQEGKTFLENGLWGTTKMYWQLWCYYHATGHNKKFYPRLMELLRDHPLKLTTIPNQHREINDMMHFAKLCCIAAQEDLTNFFTAWGFFVPLDGYEINDYSSFSAYLTKEEIEQVKAEIKSFGFKENNAIILIDDRPGLTPGERKSYNGFPIENAGQLGGLKDFTDDKANPSGSFGFSVNGTKVKVELGEEATPGVGYLIWDLEGNLLGFANSNDFEINTELASLLINGQATIQAVGADNQTTVEVTNLLISADPEKKKEMLAALIAGMDEYTKYIDQTNTKVGYIRPDAAKPLLDLFDQAKALNAQTSPDGDEITRIIQDINNTFRELCDNSKAHIGIDKNYTYSIYNPALGGYLASNGSEVNGKDRLTSSGDEGIAIYETQWVLESLGGDHYALLNMAYDKYITVSAGSVAMSYTACPFTLKAVPNKTGYFYLEGNGANTDCLVMQKPSLIYTVGKAKEMANGTQWTLTRLNPVETTKLRKSANELVKIATHINEHEAADYAYDLFMEGYNTDNQELMDQSTEIYIFMGTVQESWKNLNEAIQNSNSTPQQIDAATADLYEKTKTLAGMVELPFATLNCGTFNDGVDINEDENVVRHVFNVSEANSSIKLPKLISADAYIRPEDISVEIVPVAADKWAASEAASDEELDEEYRNAFESTVEDANIFDQYQRLNTRHVDGFFTSASAGIVEHDTDSEGNTLYDVIINVPCSGIYEISFGLNINGYLLSPTFGTPGFEATVYPNLVGAFGADNGFNIEGYTFSDKDFEHDKTIVLPFDFTPQYDWNRCIAYIPGTYFCDEYSITVDDIIHKAPAAGGHYVKRRMEVEEEEEMPEVERPANDASLYFAPVDLSALTDTNKVKATVSLTKNGASASYTFYVEKGKDTSIATEVETITIDDVNAETLFYDINGLRVINPQPGLYIRITDGKPEKVIIR